jgi:hypothetical protein
MLKSPLLKNREEFTEWMKANKFWTNKDYVLKEYERPYAHEFPCIVVATLKTCYDNKERVVWQLIKLEDFKGQEVHVVESVEKIPELDGFSYLQDVLTVLTSKDKYWLLDDKYENIKIKERKLDIV